MGALRDRSWASPLLPPGGKPGSKKLSAVPANLGSSASRALGRTASSVLQSLASTQRSAAPREDILHPNSSLRFAVVWKQWFGSSHRDNSLDLSLSLGAAVIWKQSKLSAPG